MKHNYNDRKSNRIKRANELSEKNNAKSDQLYNEAERMASVIPTGQPILTGHHSESSDRNFRKRIRNKFEKSFEAKEKASYYSNKAEAIENNNAISSDDPEAIQKLEQELATLRKQHEFMKAGNVCLRKNNKVGFLKLEGASEAIWEEVKNNQWGYNSFNLAGSNANIKRVEQRIKQLKELSALQTSEIIIKGVRFIQNVEANRVQLIFPERISKELYQTLRRMGFIYCRSESAFQRFLNPYAVQLAKNFLELMETDFTVKKE